MPWPNGPPRCRHTLSIAEYSPWTLAMQMVFSPVVNSLASPSAGRSDLEVIFVRGIILCSRGLAGFSLRQNQSRCSPETLPQRLKAGWGLQLNCRPEGLLHPCQATATQVLL